MQGKVSMVVPCYNKVKYIGAMLDSVAAQEWDNLELILVNDGSTDGTRDVIARYEPKLKARGYSVIVIDQENGGCCAAVYAGLVRMTGDYFCLVDCDDEIEPQYVSHMAGWLDANEDSQWTACSYRNVSLMGDMVIEGSAARYPYRQDTDNLLEKYMLRETITTVWIYMARVSYLKKCGLIDNFCTERRKTYEPLILVPLAFGGGKLEFFNEPLYRYNITAVDLFRFDKFEKCVKYYDDYLHLYEWSINKLNASGAEKRRLLSIAKLSYYKELSSFIYDIPGGNDYEQSVSLEFAELLNEFFYPSPGITTEYIQKYGFDLLHRAVKLNLLHEIRTGLKPGSRIIGYGAMGKSATALLPLLNESSLRPTELWDKNGDGVTVKKPCFTTLTKDDTILMLPSSIAALTDIIADTEGCAARILGSDVILDTLALELFPQFKDARLK